MEIKTLKQHKSFDGQTIFYQHKSKVTQTLMNFSCFLPRPKEEIDNAIIWLSGLTCNEENFITKSGIQKLLAGQSTMVICPDTSPRGLDLPGEHESYDFGSGAGFYVNATTEGYRDHYKMYDYIVKEIVGLLDTEFKVKNLSISGHSMGGHGALVIGLREQNTFSRVSAFSPIVNPVNSPWGKKAFTRYLGEDEQSWKHYDACELLIAGNKRSDTLLVDQGTADDFLAKELLTKNLVETCEKMNQPIQVDFQEGYDHSYYFISSFLAKHIEFLTSS